MWLIAIDEAGYGPKLGPLVVGASVWRRDERETNPRLESQASTDSFDQDAFAPIAKPVRVQNGKVRVDDSKQIFRSKSTGTGGGSLVTLHRIVSVAHHACGRAEPDLAERLKTFLPRDYATIANVPWLAGLTDPGCLKSLVDASWTPLVDCEAAVSQWSQSRWKLVDIMARMIDAGSFNRFCLGTATDNAADQVNSPAAPKKARDPKNKSDLLGETSLGLSSDCMDRIAHQDRSNEPVEIYFDRHGGRRYYAGVIQQVFDQSPVRVIAESPRQSVYETEFNRRPIRLHFTVKGDRFVPVALSSLHAKYLREVAMASLNDHFRKRWHFLKSGERIDSQPLAPSDSRVRDRKHGDRNGFENELKPTAGYPVDADRFLSAIDRIIHADGISMDELVRCR